MRKTPSPWQHYLPAGGYLSGFSASPATPARESLLWVGRRKVKKIHETKAERVGASKDIYTLPPEFAAAMNIDRALDALFGQIEPRRGRR
jgi:hypothetical protein